MTKATKKEIDVLLSEHNNARPYLNKRFIHKASGKEYQLVGTTHDVDTQELQAIFNLCTMPRLRFNRDFSAFLNNFEEVK